MNNSHSTLRKRTYVQYAVSIRSLYYSISLVIINNYDVWKNDPSDVPAVVY